MEEVLQKTSYKTEEALLRRLASVRLVLTSIFNRLTEKERREEERAKARAEAEELVKGAAKIKVENKRHPSRLSTKAVWLFRGVGLPHPDCQLL